MQTSSHCTRTCNTTAALYTKLKQRRLHYLFGHNVRMDDSQILKDLLYSEFAQGKRPTGRFQLRYKDVCKGHPKASGIDINELETSASELSTWRQAIKQALSVFKETLSEQAETIKKGQTRNALSKTSNELHLLTARKGQSVELVLPATQGAVREPPITVRHHSPSIL